MAFIYKITINKTPKNLDEVNAKWITGIARKGMKRWSREGTVPTTVNDILKLIQRDREARLEWLEHHTSVRWLGTTPCLPVRIKMLKIKDAEQTAEPPKKASKKIKISPHPSIQFWDSALNRYRGKERDQDVEPYHPPVVRACRARMLSRAWSSIGVAINEWRNLALHNRSFEHRFERQLRKTFATQGDTLSSNECRKVIQRTIRTSKGNQDIIKESKLERLERFRIKACPYETLGQLQGWLNPCAACNSQPRNGRFGPCGCKYFCIDCALEIAPSVCPRCEKPITNLPERKKVNARGFHRIEHAVVSFCKESKKRHEQYAGVFIGESDHSGTERDDMSISDEHPDAPPPTF